MSIEALEEKFYRSKPGWKDGTVEFHEIIDCMCSTDESVLLEVGPGPDNQTSAYLSARSRRLDGLDIDPRARSNGELDNVFIYDGGRFPIADESYDLVVADYVMEHVEEPSLMLREIYRVLKCKGAFVFRTPNIFHYVSLVSHFTPQSFHVATANKVRNRTGDVLDPYPTFYRFNSERSIRAIAEQAPMRVEKLRFVEKEPSYLKFNSIAYRFGVVYERVMNLTSFFEGMRANIFGVLVKDSD